MKVNLAHYIYLERMSNGWHIISGRTRIIKQTGLVVNKN